MSAAIKTVLEVHIFIILPILIYLSQCLGEDVDREGIERTPMRAAKALQFLTSGYCMSVKDVIGEGIFNEETKSDMVIVRNIDIHSLCEHHMLPFSGKVHIAYIPQGKILGLSKLARISNLFARRFQVQERLTRQIAEAIMESINPLGVGVMLEAS
jgi:GTP cyclohydrolase I